MKKTKEEALEGFLNDDKISTSSKNKLDNNNQKKIIINQREGLVERIDPIYVTKDGKQLLREQY
jgi:predicted nucleic-acid-binding protein